MCPNTVTVEWRNVLSALTVFLLRLSCVRKSVFHVASDRKGRDALPSLLMLVVTGVLTVCHGHASPISSVYLSPFASFPQKCFSETARGILVLIVFCYEILCLGGHLSNSSYKGTKTMLKNVHSELEPNDDISVPLQIRSQRMFARTFMFNPQQNWKDRSHISA